MKWKCYCLYFKISYVNCMYSFVIMHQADMQFLLLLPLS